MNGHLAAIFVASSRYLSESDHSCLPPSNKVLDVTPRRLFLPITKPIPTWRDLSDSSKSLTGSHGQILANWSIGKDLADLLIPNVPACTLLA